MQTKIVRSSVVFLSLAVAGYVMADAADGKVSITVIEKEGGVPIPCRIHLRNAVGKPVPPPKLPAWADHFVCPGTVQLELPAGKYTFEIERGPEYKQATGAVDVVKGAESKVKVTLERLACLAAEGWWSGDVHVHRPVSDMELLMRAEDLHVAPVITWWNKTNLWDRRQPPERLLVRFDGDRYYQIMGGEDEREGGALLYFHLPRPLAITDAEREYPSPMKYVAEARRHGNVWIDVEKPFWWDVPVWLAGGQVDSIGLANNHMLRTGVSPTEAWGRPRDALRLPAPQGNGFWSQEIYYHILNCGLRLPPSAESASGVLPNPVGYNRVYVHVGKDFTYEKWWEGLRAGRSFVTNGPLLRCEVNGQPPGAIFTAPAGGKIDLEIKAAVASREKIRSLDIIKDGRVERSVSFEEWSKNGSLGKVHFTRSGWFLVRAIADDPSTFRFASTAPYYVEIGDEKRRISKASAQFFLDWVQERMQRIRLRDPAQYAEVVQHHRTAEKYWREKVAHANAE